MRHVADGCSLPRLVLLLLHHEREIGLRGVGVFRVLEQHHGEEEIQLRGPADRTDGEVGVADIVHHRLHLRILRVLRRVVDRNAVRGHADLPVEERLVVVGVEPRERSRDEGLVELLAVVERGLGLGARDDDVALSVDHLAAVRPHQPVGPDVAVARGVAECEAGRQALRLVRLRELEEARGVLRELAEARFLHRADAMDDGVAGTTHRHRDPFALLGAIVLADIVPAAVLAAEIVRDVAHVHQLVRILVRILEGRDDDIGPAADVRRHRRLGPYVFPALVVDTYFDAGLLGELLGVRHPLVFVALDEALPAQHAQLCALLGFPGRRLALRFGEQRYTARCTGGDAGGNLQKIPTLDVAHGPSFWVMTFCGDDIYTSLSPLAGSKRKVSWGFNRTAVPGRKVWRSRTTAVTSVPASLQKICVSAPVGSTTTTSASTPSSATAKCSGRTPTTTSRPSATPECAGMGRCTPSPTATASPAPLRAMRPARKFIAGEPMKPATKRFAGLS